MQPHAIFINESALYALTLNSRLPTSKEFKHWVTSTVLPEIRRTGTYSIEDKLLDKLDKANQKIEKINNKRKRLSTSNPHPQT